MSTLTVASWDRCLRVGLDALNLVYISMLGSAASYGVFFYNASRGNLTALSSLTFLTPMFAAGTGFLLLGETLTPLQVRLVVVCHCHRYFPRMFPKLMLAASPSLPSPQTSI